MNRLIALTLTFAIISGQLFKLPIAQEAGPSLLDLVMAALCIIGVFNLRLHFQKFPKSFWYGTFFILICLISLILSPLKLSALEYFISLSYTLRLGLYLFFSYLVYCGAFFNSPQKAKDALILSGFGLAILGICQFIFYPDLGFTTVQGWDPHYFRAVSSFFDPNFLGAYLVLTMLLIYQNLDLKNTRSLIFFGFLYLCLLLTFSRSSFGMFLISFLILSWILRSKKIAGVSILLFLGLMAGFLIYTKLISTPRHIDRSQSASFRLNTWQQGLTLWQKNPLLGIGFNAYRYGLDQYNLVSKQQLQSHGSSTNDSSLLFVGSTTGIIGLTFFILFLFSLIFKNQPVVIAGIAGLLIHSFFSNSLFYPPILLWLFLTSLRKKIK